MGEVFAKAIREVLRHNDLRAWTDLLGLAKLVLKSEAKSSKEGEDIEKDSLSVQMWA